MPNFSYKAKSQNAETLYGQIYAEDKNDAVERLHRMGLVPVTVEEKELLEKNRGPLRIGQIRSKEIFIFSRQLVSLVKAGINILRALDIVEQQTKNPSLRKLVETIRLGVKGGKSFSDCLAEYPKNFSPLYISMVKAGEESGKLKEAIISVVEHQRQQEEIAAKVRTALAYPLVMLLFGAGTIFFILTSVMPKITSVFIDLKQTLPGPTILVMKTSAFLIQWWPWVAVTILGTLLLLKRFLKTKAGRLALSRFNLRVPFWGPFVLKVEMSRFCRSLKLLIQSGIPIVRAIQIAIPVVGNILIREELSRCQAELVAGRSFGQTLHASALIPGMVGHLISVGEESGSLVETLGDIAESFENETNESLKILTTLLEPVMIIIVGSVIGFIVIAMLLPVFELNVFSR